MKDGTERDWVYVAEAYPWFKTWGVWPDDDSGKQSVSLEDVASLRESPTRLPPDVADQIYEAGESGMGYCLFTLRFRDGSEHAFGTGNAVDFPVFPNGHSPDDIVSVAPHGGRNATSRFEMRPYLWCHYSSEE